MWSAGSMFNKIGNGSSGWRKSFCLPRSQYIPLPISIPPHEYRKNLRKSWISPGRAEPRVQSALNILDLNLSTKWVQYVAAGGAGCWALAIHFSPFVSLGWARWRKQKLAEVVCGRRHKLPDRDADAKDGRDLQMWAISLLLTERRVLWSNNYQKYLSVTINQLHCTGNASPYVTNH